MRLIRGEIRPPTILRKNTKQQQFAYLAKKASKNGRTSPNIGFQYNYVCTCSYSVGPLWTYCFLHLQSLRPGWDSLVLRGKAAVSF